MFKKVKFFLVCAGIALGVAGCSSDDGSDPKPVLKSEVYDITVEITDGVGLDHITVYKSSGTKVTTDVMFKDDGILVAVDPDNPNQFPEKKLKWEKSYSKTTEELISIIVQGTGETSLDEVNVKVMNNEEIIAHKTISGKTLLLEVGF